MDIAGRSNTSQMKSQTINNASDIYQQRINKVRKNGRTNFANSFDPNLKKSPFPIHINETKNAVYKSLNLKNNVVSPERSRVISHSLQSSIKNRHQLKENLKSNLALKRELRLQKQRQQNSSYIMSGSSDVGNMFNSDITANIS